MVACSFRSSPLLALVSRERYPMRVDTAADDEGVTVTSEVSMVGRR